VNHLLDKEHPIWPIIRVIVVAGMLWMTASKFDETEGVVIGGHSMVEVIAGVVKRFARQDGK
jgi:hypothetical protein